MKMNSNIQIALVGSIPMLVGLIFLAHDPSKFSLFVVPLTGVGTSIVATGLTSWLITKHFTGVDVTSIVQALKENSAFIRIDHTLEVIFTLSDQNSVTVSGEHSFTLVNQRRRRSRKVFAIYTDLGTWNRSGGFQSVVEPSGQVLAHNDLVSFVKEVNGKTYFIKSYDINSTSSASFRFHTFGHYRRVDRMIWTVQDLSTDFRVKLINNTGINDAFVIKINHHREKEILDSMTTVHKPADGQEIMTIDFNCEVLPYQGFEVMWNLD
jgi:hypothetical protein